MLEDPFLIKKMEENLLHNKTAAFAWQTALHQSIEVLNSAGNKILRERAEDFNDIYLRVLAEITDNKTVWPNVPSHSVIITKDLLPSETDFLNKNTVGVAMAMGSNSSHAAMILKNIGMPSLAGLGINALTIKNGTDIILNSEKGELTVNPRNIEETEKEIAERIRKNGENKLKAKEPAITKDGIKIEVKGNIGKEQEAKEAFENGSDGLGLVRTEFIFAKFLSAPSEELQTEIYGQIARTQRGKPVTMRTFDVGGDKPLPYLPLPPEDNPIMGMRGVRNYKIGSELFKTQIRALLRAGTNIKIMLPMVGFADEIIEYKEIIRAQEKTLGVSGTQIGIMIEIPAAALMAEQFAKYADFFSLGTNDLTQYALAIDRSNPFLNARGDYLNPALLKLIQMTAAGAQKYSKPVGICGAMASDIESLAVLIGLGIRDLSVVPALIPDVKAFIRSVKAGACEKIAKQCLSLENAQEARELIKAEFFK
jgi:phosphoenolpyruvate-protein phosphotransferase